MKISSRSTLSLLLLFLLTFNISAQCIIENSSNFSETSRSGTAPNQTCNYTFTPNITTAGLSGNPKLLQYTFSAGGSTIYVCYNVPTGTTVVATTQTIPCGSVNNALPSITNTNFPTATFSFPCAATGASVSWNAYNGANRNGGTGECANSTVLPVKLTSFTTKTEANGHLIQWTTAEEVNSEKFVVQRSQNAVIFNDIFTIETGANSNEPKRYSYLDESPVFGANYYRLKQIDIDGTITFSKMIVAIWETETETLFPNPISDKKFDISGVKGEVTRTRLSSMDGREVAIKLDKSGEVVSIRLPKSISSGIYYLQIETTEKFISKKIVVQ